VYAFTAADGAGADHRDDGGRGDAAARRPARHLDDVRSEVCDVIIAASVALTTLTGDSARARNEMLNRTDEILVRIAD